VKDRQEAYMADALVALAEEGSARGGKERSSPRAMIHIRVDHAALVRGKRQGQEVCEIPGVGPIPVATARAYSSDAILAGVLADEADVTRVSHQGRTISARLRTALRERDRECVVPHCHNRYRLEIDHRVPVVPDGGPTAMANLARLCKPHHYMKTHLGYRLEGGPGEWRWISPEEGAGAGERGPP
jgi:hypothetical protein